MISNASSPEATRNARNLEELVQAAYEDDRSPGSYNALARALAGSVRQNVLEAAGTSRRDRQDRRAEKVIDLLSERAVAVFNGDAEDDRDFVHGDAANGLRAIVFQTEPVPAEGQVAERIVVARGGGLDASWAIEELHVGVVRAAAALTIPDLEAEIEDMREHRDQLSEELEQLRSELDEMQSGDDA